MKLGKICINRIYKNYFKTKNVYLNVNCLLDSFANKKQTINHTKYFLHFFYIFFTLLGNAELRQQNGARVPPRNAAHKAARVTPTAHANCFRLICAML